MAAMTFRTEKLIKELERLAEKRVEHFEEMKKFYERDDLTMSQYHEGICLGLRRAIVNMMIAFNLHDTDLFKASNEYFEHEYVLALMKEREEV